MKPAATEHDIQSAIIDLLTMRGFLVLRVNSGAMLDENSGKRLSRETIERMRLGVGVLPAVLYDWPAGTPNKFDIGSLLAAGA